MRMTWQHAKKTYAETLSKRFEIRVVVHRNSVCSSMLRLPCGSWSIRNEQSSIFISQTSLAPCVTRGTYSSLLKAHDCHVMMQLCWLMQAICERNNDSWWIEMDTSILISIVLWWMKSNVKSMVHKGQPEPYLISPSCRRLCGWPATTVKFGELSVLVVQSSEFRVHRSDPSTM